MAQRVMYDVTKFSSLREMLEIARRGGACRCFLEVRQSNEAARSLYNSSEFEEIGKRRNYYSFPREDAIVMMRTL